MAARDGRRTGTAVPATTVLASAVLVEAPADADSAVLLRAADVGEWAAESDLRLVPLPSRGVHLRPDADAAERRRLGRRDEAELRVVLDRLRRDLGPDRSIAALILAEEELAGQSGRAWLRRLTSAAHATRVVLPRAIRLPLHETLDTELLRRRILDIAS